MTYRYGMDVDSKMKADAIKTDEEYVNEESKSSYNIMEEN